MTACGTARRHTGGRHSPRNGAVTGTRTSGRHPRRGHTGRNCTGWNCARRNSSGGNGPRRNAAVPTRRTVRRHTRFGHPGDSGGGTGRSHTAGVHSRLCAGSAGRSTRRAAVTAARSTGRDTGAGITRGARGTTGRRATRTAGHGAGRRGRAPAVFRRLRFRFRPATGRKQGQRHGSRQRVQEFHERDPVPRNGPRCRMMERCGKERWATRTMIRRRNSLRNIEGMTE